MKILFLSIYDPIKGGTGPSNHLKNLSDALNEAGCEVHVLTLGSRTTTLKVNGLNIHYFKPPFPFNGLFGYSIFSIKLINRIVKENKIDIVHSQSPSGFGYALLANSYVPFVVTLHGTSFGELTSIRNVSFSNTNPRLIQDALFIQPTTALLTFIEYTFADKLIAVSRSIAEEAKKFYHLSSDSITVIYNGVKIYSTYQVTKKQSCNYKILVVGRLIWRKGIKYMLDALIEILKDYPSAKLIIVGNGEQRAVLEKFVKVNQIERSVEFLGHVSAQRLLELYNEADVYVQPSLYEPFPLTILDAMELGKPVVASDADGIPELIESFKDGILVTPANKHSLALAINRIFADPSFGQKLGKNARLKVETEFTWKAIAEKTIGLYSSLIDNKNRGN